MNFGNFLGFGVILILWVFQSFFRLRGPFYHFLGLGGILVIFYFQRYFGYFLGFRGILVSF